MQNITQKWLRIILINLNVVALIGIILRYKIAYSLPFFDQKHLLHSHSNFAFTGWITQTLLILMVEYLFRHGQPQAFKKYVWYLSINLICAYGMLVGFAMQGYGPVSITFSSIAIFILYAFTISYWKDLNRIPTHSVTQKWFKAALVFNILSSIGAFSLTLMMVNHVIHQNWYLASVYFFLHFQYNGWFFFVCMGLITERLLKLKIKASYNLIFRFFLFACPPAYFLSALWLPIPWWIYGIVAIAAFLQVIAWGIFAGTILKNAATVKSFFSKTVRSILLFSALALSIKLLLQLGSVYPPLSKLAFGFRPIVIAYLHLVLLGVISIFLLGYLLSGNLIRINKMTIVGIFIFIGGIFINEILLMLQGITAITYEMIPYGNEMLLAIAIIMFVGLVIMNLGQIHQVEHPILVQRMVNIKKEE